MKRLLLVALIITASLATVVLARTAMLSSRQLTVEPAPLMALDEQGAVSRLSDALRLRTISWSGSAQWQPAEFTALHSYLAGAFPRAHAVLERETVLDYSLLYRWAGSDPTLAPILLMAHQDVVPVEPGTEGGWTYPPFEGRIADGFIWGRGAIDNKAGVMGILEAVEHLLGEGFQPRRTVLLAFGHDEEVSQDGAAATARLLAERGVTLEYVLDEGGAVTMGILPLAAPVALVGTAEKGYLSLVLTAEGAGGHSSMPPRQTAVGVLSTAIHRLGSNPFPGGLRGLAAEMFAYLGPEFPFAQRVIFANTWLFRPIIERQLAASPTTNAALRTTTAPTMLEAGIKDNVLPQTARAVVNFRIMPGESSESVIERVRQTIDDPRVAITRLGDGTGAEPSPISPSGSPAFELLQRTIHQIFPDAVVAPFLVVAATDSRHYTGLSRNVYRFLPVRLREDDAARAHGTDERIAVVDYLDAIRFYRQMLLNSTR